MKKLSADFTPALLVLTLFWLSLSGCASKPRPDWNQRIGHFGFDEAVQELGPPSASSRLEDGTTVADWFLKSGPQISFGLGTGAFGPNGGVGVGQTVALPTHGKYLRLVFGPDGQLQRWEKFKK